MNFKRKATKVNFLKRGGRRGRRIFHFSFFISNLLFGALTLRANDATNFPPPISPRDFYNAGTKLLRAGKLKDAEDLLQNSVASQDEQAQAPALYNLGLVRVLQGAELLKKGPAAGPTAARGEAAADSADEASQRADEAIASQNVEKIVAAYVRGRGVRRELHEATKAVQQALEKYSATLTKWQRASGDFKSAAELNHADADAQTNADATDRAIAALVDQINRLQQAAAKMAGAGQKLGDKMQKMKGMIPAPNMPPGAPDGDEDDDEPFGLKPGQQEGASRPGDEMKMSPETAEQLLNGYKLGCDRHLPMGTEGQAQPKNRAGKNW
jgi:tetratricopeptide (TPR) repeat protein